MILFQHAITSMPWNIFSQLVQHMHSHNTLSSFQLFSIQAFKNGLQPSPVSSIHGLQSTSHVMGAGTVQWKLTDINGKLQTIHTYALYIPSAHVHLFSPQHFCRNSRNGKVVWDHSTSYFQCRHDTAPIEFPYHSDNGLPIIMNDSNPSTSYLSSIFPYLQIMQLLCIQITQTS